MNMELATTNGDIPKQLLLGRIVTWSISSGYHMDSFRGKVEDLGLPTEGLCKVNGPHALRRAINQIYSGDRQGMNAVTVKKGDPSKCEYHIVTHSKDGDGLAVEKQGRIWLEENLLGNTAPTQSGDTGIGGDVLINKWHDMQEYYLARDLQTWATNYIASVDGFRIRDKGGVYMVLAEKSDLSDFHQVIADLGVGTVNMFEVVNADNALSAAQECAMRSLQSRVHECVKKVRKQGQGDGLSKRALASRIQELQEIRESLNTFQSIIDLQGDNVNALLERVEDKVTDLAKDLVTT